jgi:hypothetical protein
LSAIAVIIVWVWFGNNLRQKSYKYSRFKCFSWSNILQFYYFFRTKTVWLPLKFTGNNWILAEFAFVILKLQS